MAKEDGGDKPQSRKPRARLIVRLGILLVKHNSFVSFLCCVAGFIALLLLPVLAKNTYISENALMPGSANPLFSYLDVEEANKFVEDIKRVTVKEHTSMEIQKLIRQRISDIGAEFYYHKFSPYSKDFQPIHFFSFLGSYVKKLDNTSCRSFGLNSVGIIRAPRGDGKEAIVLVTPYNSESVQHSEALSLGLAFSIFSLLSRAAWLAKDIVWLAADSRYGHYSAVDSWLKEYHNPVFYDDLEKPGLNLCENSTSDGLDDVRVYESRPKTFKRAGTMAAALVIKVVEDKVKEERDGLTIYAEASNGQMPNLDLINIVNYLAVHRQGFRVKVGILSSLLNSTWLTKVGQFLEWVGKFIKALNPSWKYDIKLYDYLHGTATLVSSIYYQALGVPTGSHGAFRDYQVDAITLEISPRFLRSNEGDISLFLLRGGRLIEQAIRSVNNLLEKFHQSFFLYLLTASDKFISVGVYMIAFALLIAPLPIVSAALFSDNKQSGISVESTSKSLSTSTIDEAEISTASWRWLQAAKTVFSVHLWAMAVSLLPSLISKIPDINATTSMLIWAVVASFMLLIFFFVLGSHSSGYDWKLLKSVTIAAITTGLSLMSIINFSTAQIGAMFLVPLSLAVQPLRNKMGLAMHVKVVRASCNLALAIVSFPPVAWLMLRNSIEGHGDLGIGQLWELMELLWSWNSATYLYLMLVHLPCWVLCMHILFYSPTPRHLKS